MGRPCQCVYCVAGELRGRHRVQRGVVLSDVELASKYAKHGGPSTDAVKKAKGGRKLVEGGSF